MPKRIQRKRVKGWKMPPNTVYVGRPSKWGNPFRVENVSWCCAAVVEDGMDVSYWPTHAKAVTESLRLYRKLAIGRIDEIQAELRGKDVCCWCALTDDCHGDVLLSESNK